MKSKTCFFNKNYQFIHRLFHFVIVLLGVNACVFPANNCGAQSLKFIPLDIIKIPLYQTGFIHEGRNHIAKRTVPMFKSGSPVAHVKSANLMFPAFHESQKCTTPVYNAFFSLSLSDKPISQKCDNDASDYGYKTTQKRDDNFSSVILQVLFDVLPFIAALVGAGLAVLLIIPIQRLFDFLVGLSERLFSKRR